MLCLRYLQFINDDIIIRETFLDSVHLEGQPTGKTIAKNILKILEKHVIDVTNCRVHAYDGVSVISSWRCGASPNADYRHRM